MADHTLSPVTGPEGRARTLSVSDAVALIIGVVISVGIFRTPSIVAANAGSGTAVLLVWLAGGVFSLVGALCYAELCAAYPHTGGDYHFLDRAFGRNIAFLFAWARMTVIQTGSIAVVAFLIGDYASRVVRFGPYSATWYAALTVAVLTGVNIAGVRRGMGVQKLLIVAIFAGLAIVCGISMAAGAAGAAPTAGSLPGMAGLGTAMIFVLFTYGGWNEAAYISAEVRDPGRTMVRSLVISIGVITAVYLAVNAVLLRGLGFAAMTGSDAVAADLMSRVLGGNGARVVSALIVVAALSTLNGIIITGARTNYTLGRDCVPFGFMGKWNEAGDTPVNAYLFQGAVAFLLLAFGTAAERGFEMMVEYTAPVFWFFFLLVGVSLFVLRWKEPHRHRPFRVPLYPATPLLFCLISAFMLKSSVAYTGRGALLGIAVLLAGVPVMWVSVKRGVVE